MAVKDLLFRMLGEDTVSPVFKEISVEAEASAAKVSAAYQEAGASMERSLGKGEAAAAGGFKKIGAAAGAGALLVVGAAGLIGAKAVHMAADFQTSITKLHTTAGEAEKNLGLVSQGILDMAPKVGYTAQELADGLYTVESAGYHGAAGLQVMKAASEGARIEGADLTAVTDAVTSAMVDYHLKGALGAAEATNTLIAAVGHGKTTMQGMAAAFPNVAAAASDVGVSMQETAAAIATMTMHGTDAAKAGTYLRQTLGQLASGGSAQAQATMKGLGLSANDLSQELGSKGLAATITTIEGALTKHLTPAGLEALQTFVKAKDASGAYHDTLKKMPPQLETTFGALTKMVGGVRSLQGILQLGGKNLQTFKDNTAAITKAVDDGGKHIDGYAEYQKTFNARVNDAKAAVSALFVEIGTDLLPVFSTLADYVARGTTFLAQHKSEVEVVGVALVGLGVTLGVIAAATWAWNAALAANPITLAVIALAALAAGLYEAYQKSETFRNVVDTAFADVKIAAHGLQVAWAATVAFLTRTWARYGDDVIGVGKAIWSALKTVASAVRTVASALTTAWSATVGFLQSEWAKYGDEITSVTENVFGGIVEIVTTYLQIVEAVVRDVIAYVRFIWDHFGGDIIAVAKLYLGLVVDEFKIWVAMWTHIIEGAIAVGEYIWRTFGSTILSYLKGMLSDVVSILRGAFNIVLGVLRLFRDLFQGHWSALWDDVKQILKGAWQVIGGIFRASVSLVTLPMRLAWDIVKGDVRTAWRDVKSAVTTGIGDAVTFIEGLPGKAKNALSSLGSTLRNVVSSAFDKAVSAVETGIDNVLAWVGSIPSKVKNAIGDLTHLLWQVGIDIIEGLWGGMKSVWGDVTGWVSTAAHGIESGFRNALGIFSPSRVMMQIGVNIVEGLNKGLTSQFSNVRDNLSKLLDQIKSLADGAARTTLLNQEQSLSGMTLAWQRLDTQMQNAQSRLTSITQAARSYATSIRQGIVGNADLTGFTDTQGQSVTSFQGIVSGLTTAKNRAVLFSSVFRKLKAMGLDQTALDQLAQAGPAGLAQARALLEQGQGGVRQVNALEQQLNHAASSIGQSAADSMYGAGKDAAQGLVDGLKSKEAALQTQMRHLADTMVDEIKRLLGIHSPSTVFAGIGDNIARGLAAGADRSKHLAHAAIFGLVPDNVQQIIPLAHGRPGGRAAVAAFEAARAGRGRAAQVNIDHFHAGDMTPEQVALALDFAAA